ncbi:galactokinase family protein [Spirosoma sp.]|uniref:GHMP family kinase ATP-binding protein n=1 Tax=Spirosoma sp. TaxID=1899569 RepID=UPI003B3A369F
MADQLLVSTPGRICLFGEHQDYLGLPVIAAAISKRIQIAGHRRTDNQVVIHMPDIGATETFELTPTLLYGRTRDYFKSAITILRRDENAQFSTGFDVNIHGNIPINAGASSSSALIVTWIHFLLQMADTPLMRSQEDIARLAHRAEVLEFGEPGGMMDHYSTAVGNVIYLESEPVIRLERLTPQLGSFVLGDSGQPKDTLGILKHVKFGMLDAVAKVKTYDPTFDLHTTPLEQANEYRTQLSSDELNLLRSNLSDRDILREAKRLFTSGAVDDQLLGDLLNRHQDNLRDAKRISTLKIDRMLDAAMTAGALGGKINGSGGGGCMFAYAPNNPEAVVEAIEKQGAKAYLIAIADGTKATRLESVDSGLIQ